MIFKTLVLASDHRGFALKEALKEALSPHWQLLDVGNKKETEPVDYPLFAHEAVKAMKQGAAESGLLICGSGQGMAICANRHKGIRAVCCWTEETARLSRQHNNANILTLGAKFISSSQARNIALTFFNTPFQGERHSKRLSLIDSLPP